MAIDYNEILLQSVDLLIQERLKDQAFDITIKCEIVDDTAKSEGRYVVTDGSSKFDAYCDVADKYLVGESVYVTVPQGDYSQQKIITSKYSANSETKPVAYVPPLGTMLTMTDNIAAGQITRPEGLIANDTEETCKLIWTINLKESEYLDLQNNGVYNTLGISADFKSLFTDKPVQQGHYGLRLDLFSDSAAGSEDYIVNSIYLDSDNMFGNPFAFTTYFNQSRKYDISSLNNIWGMNLYFYQNPGSFKYFDSVEGLWVEYPTRYKILDIERKLEPNLFVKDINISLGEDLLKVPDNQFKIYSHNPVGYNQFSDIEGYNYKDIHSIWYNKDTETNEFIGFTDGVVDLNYDEDRYLQEYQDQMQGAIIDVTGKNIPSLKETLQMYSNMQYMQQLLKGLYELIGQSIYDLINKLRANLIAYDVDQDLADLAISDLYKSIDNNLDHLMICMGEQEGISIQDYYLEFLNNYYDMLEKLKIDPNTYVKEYELNLDVNKLINAINNNWNKLNGFVKNTYEINVLQKIVEDESKASVRVVVEKSYEKVQAYLANGQVMINDLVNYRDIQADFAEIVYNRFHSTPPDIRSFDEEYQEFISKNANKYCIYWYRYEQDYADPAERFLKPNWRRITATPTPGMPAVTDGVYDAKSTTYWKNVLMNYKVQQDRFKAILFFNHEMFESNELVFENEQQVSDISNIISLVSALGIEHGQNSSDSYQAYSSYYTLLNKADSMKSRELKVTYDDKEHDENYLSGMTIYWYVPNNATMLTVNDTKLCNQLGFSNLNDSPDNTEDEDIKKFQSNIKEGYHCYYKRINFNKELDASGELINKVVESDLTFYYSIAKRYDPTFGNNTIICRIVDTTDNYFEATKTFTFSTYGTSGTDYTLAVLPSDRQTAVVNVEGEIYPLQLESHFSDYNGETVDGLNAPPIFWEWIGPNGGLNLDNGLVGEDSVLNFDTSCLYNVLKIEANWQKINEEVEADQTLTLSTFYPVPYSTGFYYIEGASTVIYDGQGINPSFYEGSYKIFNADEQEVTNVHWELKHYDSNGKIITDERILRYLPSLGVYTKSSTNSYKEGYYLRPKNMYIANLNAYTVIICYKDGTPIWAQPIYIGQNQHGLEMLNSWDETLTIDENNGTILTTMIGAGSKDEENRFNGLLMGNVKAGNESPAITGLYGYHEGVQSFGWLIDGTGFIGKVGRGQIIMDGNNGVIRSGDWAAADHSGMQLDIDNGILEMRSDKNGDYQSFITLSTGYDNQPYFQVLSDTGKELIVIKKENYFLQSNNYIKDKSGMKIDLINGHIDAFDFKLTSGNVSISSAGDPYIRIVDPADGSKSLLYISKDGNYYIRTSQQDSTKGILFDLTNGRLEAKDGFSLVSTLRNTNKSIVIDTVNESISYPFRVGENAATNDTGAFKIGWDGSLIIGSNFSVTNAGILTATGIQAYDMLISTGRIGGWTITPTALSGDGIISGGTITGSVITAKELYADKGVIGGWQVQPNSGGLGSSGWSMSPSGGISFGSGNFGVDGNGILTAKGAILEGLIVTSSGVEVLNAGNNGLITLKWVDSITGPGGANIRFSGNAVILNDKGQIGTELIATQNWVSNNLVVSATFKQGGSYLSASGSPGKPATYYVSVPGSGGSVTVYSKSPIYLWEEIPDQSVSYLSKTVTVGGSWSTVEAIITPRMTNYG